MTARNYLAEVTRLADQATYQGGSEQELADETSRLVKALEAVLEVHVRIERLLCGAMAEVPHRHGNEKEPHPVRPVTCTEEQGHSGPHRDAACCWNFQVFTEHAAFKSAEWADRSACSSCGTKWPCPTVRAIESALEGEQA